MSPRGSITSKPSPSPETHIPYLISTLLSDSFMQVSICLPVPTVAGSGIFTCIELPWYVYYVSRASFGRERKEQTCIMRVVKESSDNERADAELARQDELFCT